MQAMSGWGDRRQQGGGRPDNVTPFRRNGGRQPGHSSSHPPAINLPPATKVVALVLVVIHVLDWISGGAIARYCVFTGLRFSLHSLITLFTYALIHANPGHLAMNIVSLAILGKVLEPRIGARWLVIMLAMGSGVGAIVHTLISSGYLIGISAGVGALYGVALPGAKTGRFGPYDRLIILLSILFVAVSVLGLMLPILPGVAHAAHLGGFLAGLFMSHRLIR